MPTLTWNSCTGPSNSPAEALTNLRAGCHLKQHLTPLSDARILLAVCLSYLATVAILRTRYRHKGASFAHNRFFILLATAHNITLSLASLAMNVGVSAAIYDIIYASAPYGGLTATVCTSRDLASPLIPQQLQFWMYIFYISKFWELLDTVLLILRGKALTLLHVWHHATVMVETWAWLEFGVTVGAYGMWFNTFVHVFMYAYYAAALLKITFPMKMMITLTQIVQFITGFCSLIPFAYFHSQGKGCTGVWGLVIAAFINGSYLILFIQFFWRAYTKPTNKRSQTVIQHDSKKIT